MLSFVLFASSVAAALALWAIAVPKVAAARLQLELGRVRNELVVRRVDGTLPSAPDVNRYLDFLDMAIEAPELFSFSRALSLQIGFRGDSATARPSYSRLDGQSRTVVRSAEQRAIRAISRYMVRSSALWPVFLVAIPMYHVYQRLVGGHHGPQAPTSTRPSILATAMVRSSTSDNRHLAAHA